MPVGGKSKKNIHFDEQERMVFSALRTYLKTFEINLLSTSSFEILSTLYRANRNADLVISA